MSTCKNGTSAPTRAVILAAGFGTRMRPLTYQCPKALLPLWNKPMLRHTLDMLERWGVMDVLINMHHLPDAVLAFARHYPGPLHIDLSYEPEILGTGGALRKAAWFLRDDEAFWMVNADVAADLDPAPLLRLHHARKALATLWLHAEKGPRTVEMSDNIIQSFRSKRAGSAGTYTFCGLQLLSPAILSFLPEEGFSSIITGYERAQKEGRRISGATVPDSYWADIGNPQDYLKAHEEIQRAGREQQPGQALYDPSAHGPCEDIFVPAALILTDAETRALRVADMSSPEHATCAQLPARGSARSFFRIREAQKNIILIRYSTERLENQFYAAHTRVLQRIGCQVPTLYHEDRKNQFLLMEDVGNDAIETWIQGKKKSAVMRMYKKAIDQAILMHTKGLSAIKKARVPLMPPFTAALYAWEHDLFTTHFLPPATTRRVSFMQQLKTELSILPRLLANAPPVLIHRDLQSSNLYRYKNEVYLIDYQGMRKGAAAYDLASLLYDPYVKLTPDMQKSLLDYYIQCTNDPPTAALFPYAAIQRLLQALGAYGRLGNLPGTRRFARYIPGACRRMREVLDIVPEPFDALRSVMADTI
ncbi:MAG: hypothetical protein EOM20_04700 [Spartobacteria bacterium]|nr:hypothetical protein [Spartobacteria bacterium]